MRITISHASTKLVIHRAATRQQKLHIAKSAASAGLSPASTDIDALITLIQRGNIYLPALLHDKRTNENDEFVPPSGFLPQKLAPTVENFLASNLVVLDFDNTNTNEPMLSWQQALEHPYIQKHACLLHESPNFTPEQNRFRVLFLLPKNIENYHAWQEVCKDIGEHFPKQYDIIRNPTWGFQGCRVQFVHKDKRIQVLQQKEFARLTEQFSEAQPSTSSCPTERDQFGRPLGRPSGRPFGSPFGNTVSLEEAEKMLSFIPEHSEYDVWQAIVFGIAHAFEQHEAEQLIEQWSPGRDRHYKSLIRRAAGRASRRSSGRAAEARVVTIATVIQEAKKYGYEPPKYLYKNNSNDTLRFDHTLHIKRWVAEAERKLSRIILNNSKTLLVSRTNNGKSTFVELLATTQRVLLITPLTKLSEQQAEKLKKAGAVSVTGGEDPTIAELYFKHKNFVCSTPEMLLAHADCIEHFDVVVLDEIHELRRMDYRPQALRAYHLVLQKARKVLGLTATLTDNIFRDEGFTTVLLQDERNDTLDIIPRDFPTTDEHNNSIAYPLQTLACSLIKEHLLRPENKRQDKEQNNQQNDHSVLVLRVQSKNAIKTITTYCKDVLALPEQHLAVLTGQTKELPTFEFITKHQRLPDDIRVVLTTSVFDIGIDVFNTNIARIAMLQPIDHTEIIQFSARFRSANVPVECFFSSQLQPDKAVETKNSTLNNQQNPDERSTDFRTDFHTDFRWLYHKQVEETELVVNYLNISKELQKRGLYPEHSISPAKSYAYGIALENDEAKENTTRHYTNTLMIAAKLYKQQCLALKKDRTTFFETLQHRYPYCRVHYTTAPTSRLEEEDQRQLEQIGLKQKQKQQSLQQELLRLFSEHTESFLLNVFYAHPHQKSVRHKILLHWEGMRRAEDEHSRKLKEQAREQFAENIFADSFALVLSKRYLHLRQLLLGNADAVRLVSERHNSTAWHNTLMALEVQRRQFLLREAPEQLPVKWRREAEAIAEVAALFQKQGRVPSKDVQSLINGVAQKSILYVQKREASQLATILFGKFKRQGKQKACYYDGEQLRTLPETLEELGIDAAGYLHTLRTRLCIEQAVAQEAALQETTLQEVVAPARSQTAGRRCPSSGARQDAEVDATWCEDSLFAESLSKANPVEVDSE